MTITLDIAPELESQIRQAAAKAGLAPDVYLIGEIERLLQGGNRKQSNVKQLPQIEANLLQKINQSFSQIEWMHYRELVAKRQAETLTEDEQVELIALSDQIEEANAKRIEYVAELADIRNMTLPELVQELGLKPFTYA
ncbi:hypothetical protein KFU94_24550 [Chloroflexi bacterium TSY]|nr:hypothetical protein [Chloroflexi bacterium TSY]